MTTEFVTPEAKYKPDTKYVRGSYTARESGDEATTKEMTDAAQEFDRWLVSVKAEAAATALEEARNYLYAETGPISTMAGAVWLTTRAAAIRSEVK